MANVKKEDHLFITIWQAWSPINTNQVEARKWIKDIVGGTLDKIFPESSSKIQFVSPIRRKASVIPM